MDPQQEFFTELFLWLKEKGYDVYDGFLPPEGAVYPFIYLADSQQTDDVNKMAVFGNVYQTIHVWHNNPMQRGTVSGMLGTDEGNLQETTIYKVFCMGFKKHRTEDINRLHYKTAFIAWRFRSRV